MRTFHLALWCSVLAASCGDPEPDDNATCGNSVVEAGETCDGDCPTSCDDGRSCTIDSLTGSAESCNAQCVFVALTTCVTGDDCCPQGCDVGTDADCNDVACNDGEVEGHETCDGDCPTSCDDGDACTDDFMTGSASTCDVVCDHYEVTSCNDDDGCCAPTCSVESDNDCTQTCVENDNSTAAQCAATTVEDPGTGLLWQKGRACFGDNDWFDAVSYCQSLVMCGHTGWRLPAHGDFVALLGGCDADVLNYDPGRCNACQASTACQGMFPGDSEFGSWYWTSTEVLLAPNLIWYFGLHDGIVGAVDKDLHNYTRCVYGP